MNANAIALDARGEIRKDMPSSAYKVGDEFKPFHPSASHVSPEWRDGWNACFVAAIAALEAEPQDTTVLVRLHRPEGYEDVHPELVMEDAHIHPDFRPELANGLGRAEPQGWRPISEAPKDGLFQDGNNHYAEYILAWHPAASLPYRARWWFRDDTGACNFLADGGYAVFPTVFQPLPTPPKD